MAWYPGATKRELEPESDAQPAIRPTQFILHSIAAPWSGERMYEYWRDSTNLESHFGCAYDGGLWQYIGTETRADANASANRRSDGTGAVSVETASNLEHTDPWTDAQVDSLIRLGVWLHERHDLPLRICRTWDDPGYGYHRLFAKWSISGTACPGDARVRQFHDRVFPGIVAGTGGTPVPDIPAPRPAVDLAELVAAARSDPSREGTPVTYVGTRMVENALVAEGLLARNLADGHYGTATLRAYAEWQRRLGYNGSDADGIPGRRSLTRLGAKYGFTVA
ncbi:N-acetylmuramoyl-L-alanine amidase [Embleya sp. NBC_00888]|uniref:N-acetylmuramoyl-L-alanine amidase n=1 Tax=Embleya sp. NBC_00888 TaxID=2975960 RepID=UPI00386F35CC|nr:N-acetylmuramoyl-L-alanine amidase [Embleya sp. NBC_00888]